MQWVYFYLPQRFPHFCPVFRLVLFLGTFPAFSLFLSFLKKEEGQENKLEIFIPSFFCNSIPFIKTRNHLIFPAASLQEVLKWSLGSVSTRGRSATYNIAEITVYVKSWFTFIGVFSFVLPVSFLAYTFSCHFPILSLLIRRKEKEDLRKKQGTEFGSILFVHILCLSVLFSFEKIKRI